MIYHALFVVNHVPYGLMIETALSTPNPKVLEAAELAFEVHDYTGIKVLADRGDVFAQKRHIGPYLESELIKWIQAGQGVFQWNDLIRRQPLSERKDHGRVETLSEQRPQEPR